MARYPESPTKGAGDLERFACVVEPDFGNMGFGRPDAILRFDFSARHFVVIVEAKLTGFEKACWQCSRRAEKTFNSRLNGQLELDYRLAMALAEFKDGMSALEEPNWVPYSPYGKAQSLKKGSVLKTLVAEFSGKGLDLGGYYYLVMTTDEQNPFDRANDQYLPQLFKGEFEGNKLVFPNRWQELRSKFGWTNYKEMMRLIKKIEGRLPVGSLFLPTYELYEMNKGILGLTDEDSNGEQASVDKIDDEVVVKPPRGNGIALEPPLRGGWIVRFKNELCHLSCQEYSYKLRRLRGDTWDEFKRGKADEKDMRAMLSHVEVLQKDRRTIDDVPYWRRRLNEFKNP